MTMTPPGQLLRSISDTACLVAYHRFMESERPDAIFRDRHAGLLAGGLGERIAQTLRWGRRGAWSTIVRTALFDELISRLLADGQTDVVLNLAAGLDTRPYRMRLPASIRWVDADLPEILAYKAEKLAGETANCTLEQAAVDLAKEADRRALLARVNDAARRVLVLSEGLLIYLAPEQVGALAADLRSQSRFVYWIIDLVAPMVLRRMNQMLGKALTAAGAKVQFGPPEGTAFFAPFGWRESEFHDLVVESRRLRRPMPFDALLRIQKRLFPRLFEKRYASWRSGVVLLAPM